MESETQKLGLNSKETESNAVLLKFMEHINDELHKLREEMGTITSLASTACSKVQSLGVIEELHDLRRVTEEIRNDMCIFVYISTKSPCRRKNIMLFIVAAGPVFTPLGPNVTHKFIVIPEIFMRVLINLLMLGRLTMLT